MVDLLKFGVGVVVVVVRLFDHESIAEKAVAVRHHQHGLRRILIPLYPLFHATRRQSGTPCLVKVVSAKESSQRREAKRHWKEYTTRVNVMGKKYKESARMVRVAQTK